MEKKVRGCSLQWVHKPKLYIQNEDSVVIETEPFTSLRPQGKGAEAKELYLIPNGNFHFTVRVDYRFSKPFDQCGLLLYNGNVRKAVFGTEMGNGNVNKLSCIVYHEEGGDRSERDIGADISWMYYRIWFRSGSIRIQFSFNGKVYSDLREFGISDDEPPIRIGIYACSPMDSWFDCTFSEMRMSDEGD